MDFIAYSLLFTLHMLLYSICIPADPSEMCRSEFCCFALGLTASPSGQTACCFFSPMKINAMNNAIWSILAGTLTNKSAWFFFPELVYEAYFSAVFPLWILPFAVFIAGECARSSPNRLCLLASVTVMFRANKQFYRAQHKCISFFLMNDFFVMCIAGEGPASPLSSLREPWNDNETWPWGLASVIYALIGLRV